jgi:hypothetical protein
MARMGLVSRVSSRLSGSKSGTSTPTQEDGLIPLGAGLDAKALLLKVNVISVSKKST